MTTVVVNYYGIVLDEDRRVLREMERLTCPVWQLFEEYPQTPARSSKVRARRYSRRRRPGIR